MTGKTITLLGAAGFMGRGIIRDLVSDRAICPIDEIRVCDLDADIISQCIAETADTRLTSWPLDVRDNAALRQALAGSDLCLNSVPTLAGFQLQIFETALDAGCDYMDLGGLGVYTIQQLEWRERFSKAGVTAVLGAGADPGLSNVICRAVADQLDTIDKINLYWAAELVGDENPILVPPYSVSTVLAEYAHPSTQFLQGEHVECPPLSGTEYIDLPEPWGRTEFIYSPHSEQLTVPLASGIKEKGIREFTWKLHLPHREHEAWVGLIKAGFGDFNEPVEIDNCSIKPVDFLNKLIARNIENNKERIPQQQSWEIHFAIGEGLRNDQPVRVRCEVTVRPDSLYDDYVDACTSMNASIAAQFILQFDAKPGVWSAEEYFEVEPYFEEVRKRNMKISLSVENIGS